MPITNLTVLITGSTGGLGAALAEKLYERGANLALLDLDQATVTAQAAALGERAHGWVADVRSEDALRAAINAAADHFGGLDVVIANAGIGVSSSLANGTVEEFDRIVDVNLNGVWRTFHAALPHVFDSKGYLLAISSMAAFIHAPLMGAYNASKAGVLAMCDSIHLENHHLGVSVGTVHPTFFQTNIIATIEQDPAGHLLFDSNQKHPWKMVPKGLVVRDIVRGIETRKRRIVIPRQNSLIARLPQLGQRIVERVFLRQNRIERVLQVEREQREKRAAAAIKQGV